MFGPQPVLEDGTGLRFCQKPLAGHAAHDEQTFFHDKIVKHPAANVYKGRGNIASQAEFQEQGFQQQNKRKRKLFRRNKHNRKNARR